MSMTFISYIIFIIITLINQQKNAKSLQENFIPKLLDSLRRNGHVKNPDIIIESEIEIHNQMKQ